MVSTTAFWCGGDENKDQYRSLAIRTEAGPAEAETLLMEKSYSNAEQDRKMMQIVPTQFDGTLRTELAKLVLGIRVVEGAGSLIREHNGKRAHWAAQ